MTTLGDLVVVTKGRKPSILRSLPEPGDRRALQIDDLRPGATKKFGPPELRDVLVEPTDIVLAWDGANAGTASFGLDGAIGSTLSRLRPSQPDSSFTPYLGRMVQAKEAYLRRTAKGATVPHVSPDALASIEVVLPSMDDQRRIAAILDQADAIRAQRREALGGLSTLQVAIFLSAFGNPLLNSRGLPRARIGDVARVITGNSPSRTDATNFGSAIEWVKSDNLGTRVASMASEGLSEAGMRKARIAPVGSVLVTCIAGSASSIGKSSLVDRDVAFNQQINAVLPSPRLDSGFLLAQLKTAPELVRAKSTGGMKGLVSKSAFESIEVLLPPVGRQQEFAALVARIDAQHALVERALAADDELFASLQSRAFSGML